MKHNKSSMTKAARRMSSTRQHEESSTTKEARQTQLNKAT
jgi:hypothetical protein